MPQIKSAQKRMKQTATRTARNRAHKERLKKAVKKFKAEVAGGAGALPAALGAVHKAYDKAGAKGVLHKNAVNRRKSRAAVAAHKASARPQA